MLKLIVLGYIWALWTGFGIYMGARYLRRLGPGKERPVWALPLIFGQGVIWAFGVFAPAMEALR